MFLAWWQIFWGRSSIFEVTIKGQKFVEAMSNKKNLTSRKVHTPAQKRKDKIHQDFFRLLDSGLLFLNTDKKPWGDHEIMARIHPSWRSHLCSLLGCSFNGLGAPWPLRMGRMGWMSCCVGCIQHYPNMEKCREEVPGVACPTSSGMILDMVMRGCWVWVIKTNTPCWPKQWFQRWPSTIGIYGNPSKHRRE